MQNKTQTVRKFIYKQLKSKGVYKINGKPLSMSSNKDLSNAYSEIFDVKITSTKKGFVNSIENVKSNQSQLRKGQIYVIGNDQQNICKIGYSKNPLKRMESIQTGCPYPLRIIAVFEGTIETEKKLHKKYQKYRMHGEWFKYSGSIKESLKSFV